MLGRLALKALHERVRAPRGLARQQHHQLVATRPVAGVDPANRHAQALGDGANPLVAGLMPERIVDLLQPVDVEHDDAEARPRPRVPLKLPLQVLVEGPVVAEPGEAVRERRRRKACEFLLAGALDAPAVADEATEHDERSQEPEAEEHREPDQLRELEVVRRPFVGAVRKGAFGSPDTGNDGDCHENHRERPESPALEDGQVLDGSERDLGHCVGVGQRAGSGAVRRGRFHPVTLKSSAA
jgi:hypothetical protein